MSHGLTSAEQEAMKLTAQLTDLVVRDVIGDGPTRDADIAEFVQRIHTIQNSIMAQAAARAHPDLYRLLGETVGRA